jgi:hypothetical protein
VRVEFKSKAVVHFDQYKTPIASASLADDGAVHTVAINALTVFYVVNAHRLLAPVVRVSGWLCRKLRKVVVMGTWKTVSRWLILPWCIRISKMDTRMASMQGSEDAAAPRV